MSKRNVGKVLSAIITILFVFSNSLAFAEELPQKQQIINAVSADVKQPVKQDSSISVSEPKAAVRSYDQYQSLSHYRHSSDTAQGVSVSGSVYNSDKVTPADGGYIWVYRICNESGDWNWEWQVDISTDGKFTIDGLQDGTYQIIAVPNKNSGYSQSSAIILKVINGQPNMNNINVDFTTPQAELKVLDKQGAQVTNCIINAYKMDGDKQLCHFDIGSYSDTDGWLLGGLSEGSYRLMAVTRDGAVRSPAKYITIDTNGNCSENNITLQLNKIQLSGKVLNNDGSASMSNGIIRITERGEDRLQILYENCYRATNGTYKISGLKPGHTYYIDAEPDENDKSNWRSDEIKFTVDNDGNALKDGQVITAYDFKFTNIIYNGIVTNPDGTPGSSGYIDVINIVDNGSYGLWNVPIRSDGSFSFGSLKDGTYSLMAKTYENNPYTDSLKKIVQVVNNQIITPNSDLNFKFTNQQLSVTVNNSDGTPLTQNDLYYIEIQKQDEQSLRWYKSVDGKEDSNGTFKGYSIGGLEPGTYKIIARPNDNNGYPSEGETINIDADYNSDRKNIVLTIGKTQLSGKVYKSDGITPAKFGHLNVYEVISEHSARRLNSFDIDENGNYSIGGLESNKTYRILAYPGTDDSNSDAQSNKIIVKTDGNGNVMDQNGNAITNLNFTFNKTQISGYVFMDTAKTLKSNCGWISVQSIDDDSFSMPNPDVDENGHYYIAGLKPGKSYILRAFPDGNQSGGCSKAVEIKINTDGSPVYAGGDNDGKDASDIDFAFCPLQLTAKVKDQSNNYLNDVCGISINDSDGNEVLWLNPDSDGNFNIASLEPGNYTVQAWPYNGENYVNSDVVNITINPDGTYTGSGIELILKSPQCTGKVYFNGSPVSNARVAIRKNGRWITKVWTDSEGKFLIGGLEKGTYTLEAYPNLNSENMCSSNEKEITISDVPADNVELDLTTPQVIGTVKDMNSNLITSGYIKIAKVLDNGNFEELESVDITTGGKFCISNLQEGCTYSIAAVPLKGTDYAASFPKNITIKSGEVLQPELTLTLPQIKGTVTGSNGEAVIGGTVFLMEKATDTCITSAEIDENGVFRIGGISLDPAKEYAVMAQPYSDDMSYTSSNEVTCKSGDMDVIIRFNPVQLLGSVTSQNGNNFSNGYIDVQKLTEGTTDDWQSVGSSDIIYNALYKIGGLSDGQYRLKAYSYDNVNMASDFYNFTISNGKLLDNITNPIVIKTVNLIYGDANNDGKIGNEDCDIIKDQLKGKSDIQSDMANIEDMDGDGKVTSADYAILKRLINGKISKAPRN